MQPYWDITFSDPSSAHRTVITRVYANGRTDVEVPEIRVRPN
jgi:hypothetical protein